MGFLSHWNKHQEDGKQWPLKFLKLKCQVFEEDDDRSVDGDGGSEGKATEDADYHDGESDEERAGFWARQAAKGKDIAQHGKARGVKKKHAIEGVDGDGSASKATEDEDDDDGDHNEEQAGSWGNWASNGKGVSKHCRAGGEKEMEDVIELPTTPAQVDTLFQKRFVRSLSSDAGYKKLVKLLDTVNVSIVYLIWMW